MGNLKWKIAGLVVAALLAACESENIATAKRQVQRQLKDPGSAQFQDLVEYKDGTVCGQVNAKNAMGGYVGFEQFVVPKGRDADVRPSERMMKVWCSEQPKKALAELEMYIGDLVKLMEDACKPSRPEKFSMSNHQACEMAKSSVARARTDLEQVRKTAQ